MVGNTPVGAEPVGGEVEVVESTPNEVSFSATLPPIKVRVSEQLSANGTVEVVLPILTAQILTVGPYVELDATLPQIEPYLVGGISTDATFAFTLKLIKAKAKLEIPILADVALELPSLSSGVRARLYCEVVSTFKDRLGDEYGVVRMETYLATRDHCPSEDRERLVPQVDEVRISDRVTVKLR